jgi:hypothetical protein
MAALNGFQDDPPELILSENAPRIASHGRHLMAALPRACGYVVGETTNDCGQLGGLAPAGSRFLLVARHNEEMLPFLYRAAHVTAGKVLGHMPLPSDLRTGATNGTFTATDVRIAEEHFGTLEHRELLASGRGGPNRGRSQPNTIAGERSERSRKPLFVAPDAGNAPTAVNQSSDAAHLKRFGMACRVGALDRSGRAIPIFICLSQAGKLIRAKRRAPDDLIDPML